MGIVCCVSCGKNSKECTTLVFHTFPVAKTELCKQWEKATRLKAFKATGNNVICSEHFRAEDYRYTGSKKLRDEAIPSVFSFTPSDDVTSAPVRKPPAKRPLPVLEPETSQRKSRKEDFSSEDLVVEINLLRKTIEEKDQVVASLQFQIAQKDRKILDQKTKIRMLQQKVRRRTFKINEMTGII